MMLGQPATGEDFCGRRQELDDLWRYLENEHIRFPGVRRLGKTSILKRLQEQAAEQGVLARWLDVSHIHSAESFVLALEQAYPPPALRKFANDQAQSIAGWFSRLRRIDASLPEIIGGGGLGIELGDGPMPDWLVAGEVLRQRLQPQPLLILLDEFPVMLQTLLDTRPAEAQQLLAWLRIWRQTGGPCRFVFTGSIGLQSLLERHHLADKMNDCYDYPLGAFRPTEARAMWQKFTQQAGSSASDEVIENALTRLGWLSPYFLCLLLDETLRAARERQQENPTPADRDMLILSDVHDAYEKLLANRSRFYHWELRLKTTLPASELALCQDLLKHVSRHADGLTLRQLHSRLSKHEADAERRTQRLQDLLVRLSDEGYLSPPSASQRVQFLSFPLRDWWSRNHV